MITGKKGSIRLIIAVMIGFILLATAIIIPKMSIGTNSLFAENNIQASHVEQAKNAVATLERAGYDCFVARGASMQPRSFQGNTACSIPYNGQELFEGMIVIFKNEQGGKTSHRIVAVYENEIITQGDNNNISERVSKDLVEGIVIATLDT